MKRFATQVVSAATWLVLIGCERVREPATHAPPANPQSDAGALAPRDVPAAPLAVATGSLEGVVSLTAPIPPARPIAIDAETARRRGCADAARGYYANVFGNTAPGALAEAVVTVDARDGAPAPPRRRSAVFRDCHIEPRILAMTLGDDLFLRAETDEHHLPKVDGLGATIAQMLNRNEEQQKFIQRPGRYILHSVTFPNWMQTPIVVTPNRFYDQTNREGHFRIERVPVGTYVAHAWFPGATPVNVTLTITAGATTTQNFSVTPLPAEQIRPNQPDPIDAGAVIP